MKILDRLTEGFPLWVLAASLLALLHPPLFTWFSGPMITAGLGVIMLGMGLTLRLEDFQVVAKRPSWVFTGVFLQYTVMPLLGWFFAWVFQLSAPFAAGLILVSCCPGGTASNVISYLARVDVPLSVTMTAVSTFLAAVMTPLLSSWLIGNRVDVNVMGLFIQTVQVVILPVVAGIMMNRWLPRLSGTALKAAPLAAVLMITMIVASIIGSGREPILRSGAALLLAVFSLHAAGYFLGYWFSRWMIRYEIQARTISIEVGMQNSGLGVVLAKSNFADPLTAIPCAISSLFHSLIGSFLAALWRRKLPPAGVDSTP